MDRTEHYELGVTDDGNTRFQDWRRMLTKPGESNMDKIEDALDGKLNNSQDVFARAVAAGYTGTEDQLNAALAGLSNAPFLPLSGGTMSGRLTMSNDDRDIGIVFSGQTGNGGTGDRLFVAQMNKDAGWGYPEEGVEDGGNLTFVDYPVFYVDGRPLSINQDVHMNGCRVDGLLPPQAYHDAANKWYVDKRAKRTARFVVGTSTAGWTAADCDYLCDGTADDVEINAAITALPDTGGEIIILDGTYNITAPIAVNKDCVTLSGNGAATILKRAFQGRSDADGIIYITSSYNTIRYLQIDGVRDTYTTIQYDDGIRLWYSNYNIIIGNICCNNSSSGISLLASNYNTVARNVCNNNNSNNAELGHGIDSSYGKRNIFDCNICNNNRNGIDIRNQESCIITGNMCEGNSDGIYLKAMEKGSITGNVCYNNRRGIYLFALTSSGVANNICNTGTLGIVIEGTSTNNVVNGNICKDNEEKGIFIYESSKNVLVGNACIGNLNDGIALGNSERNTISGNMAYSDNKISTTHHIYLYQSDYNLVSNNNVYGMPVIVDGGTGNLVTNNLDGDSPVTVESLSQEALCIGEETATLFEDESGS